MEPDTTAFEEAKAEESLSDSFLDRLHALMRHENVETVLSLQTDMYVSERAYSFIIAMHR